ncbi:glycosyltransferase [Vibrio alginolyticus]|uniref:glycosyltransferase n=1 Tax=Vibrio alginolyticus TaxID=663 RepID=UPI001BD601C1|nr:glycosyltransferase [Vibrio alginolyticus]MBS9854712.1 glycosyltransferase [Vibrio alginolyticus]
MNNVKINFFLNSLSIHQAPLISELSKEYDVNVYYETSISQHRKQMGWSIPSFNRANIRELSLEDLDIDNLKLRGVVNIFSGLNAYPKISYVFKKSTLNSESKNYVQMEKYTKVGLKGAFKDIYYRVLAKLYNEKISGVLCQGGKENLERVGFKNVYDFAYFINKPYIKDESSFIENESLKLIFVGVFDERKNILTLIDSFKKTNNPDAKLHIYGVDGQISRERIINYAASDDRIEVKGKIENISKDEIFKLYDYLILPSTSEGWGVVASEALVNGVGVIVSSECGISSYLRKNFNSLVKIFDIDKSDDLYEKLNELKPLTSKERQDIHSYSDILSAEYGSRRFSEIVFKF